MHIALITDTFAPDVNGVSRTLEQLTRQLLQQGHQITLFRGADEMVEKLDGPNLREVRIFSQPLACYRKVRIGFPAFFTFNREFRKNKPDVLYIATESPMGVAGMLVARHHQIPIVSGYHTNFTSYLPSYNLEGLVGIGNAYLRWFHNCCFSTIVPSQDTEKVLKDRGYKNVSVMGRGVDSELFNPNKRSAELRASWGAGLEDRVCLLVGRMAREKNLNFALDALRAKQHCASGKVITVVAGDGPLLETCQAEYPWVKFPGELSAAELATYYASADCLVFPSRTETFGNVLLESLASGLPPVAFDYAAARFHLTPGQNGWAADLENPADFIQKLYAAVDAPAASMDAMRAAARQSAEEWSWERTAQQFLHLLRTALQPAPVSHASWNPSHATTLSNSTILP